MVRLQTKLELLYKENKKKDKKINILSIIVSRLYIKTLSLIYLATLYNDSLVYSQLQLYYIVYTYSTRKETDNKYIVGYK